MIAYISPETMAHEPGRCFQRNEKKSAAKAAASEPSFDDVQTAGNAVCSDDDDGNNLNHFSISYLYRNGAPGVAQAMRVPPKRLALKNQKSHRRNGNNRSRHIQARKAYKMFRGNKIVRDTDAADVLQIADERRDFRPFPHQIY